MKLKTLLLGSAAVFAISSAQAAETVSPNIIGEPVTESSISPAHLVELQSAYSDALITNVSADGGTILIHNGSYTDEGSGYRIEPVDSKNGPPIPVNKHILGSPPT